MSPVQNLGGVTQYFQLLLPNDLMCGIGIPNTALTIFGISIKRQYFSPVMKNLIIHPADPSTEFLTTIYANISNKTVVRGALTKLEVQELIESHEKVIILGHGSPFGLMNPGQFLDAGLFIIDGSMVDSLLPKSSCIYIWCNADQFLENYGLSGLCSGMFISEIREAYIEGFNNIGLGMIDQSNEKFTSIISRYIDEPLDILYQSLLLDYGVVARSNPIAKFNSNRLHLLTDGTHGNLTKMAV